MKSLYSLEKDFKGLSKQFIQEMKKLNYYYSMLPMGSDILPIMESFGFKKYQVFWLTDKDPYDGYYYYHVIVGIPYHNRRIYKRKYGRMIEYAKLVTPIIFEISFECFPLKYVDKELRKLYTTRNGGN